MSIKLITFKTNHTIIGDVTESAGTVIVKQPVQVINVPPKSAGDTGGIAFSPFLEYCQEFGTGIKFQSIDILTITSPMLELENQYNRIFGSGIEIAPAGMKI